MEKHKHKILSIQIEACKVYLVPIISSGACSFFLLEGEGEGEGERC